jgi:hypothetical protein
MSSRIYANGNQTTAIANITADVATYISFNANGEKVLNVQGLQGYLETQFALVASSEFVSPATASSAAAAAKTVNTAGLVNGLNSTIDISNWQGRSDWPTSAEVLGGSTLVGAVKDAMALCDSLAAAVTNYYVNLDQALAGAFNTYYQAAGIDAVVPQGIVPIIEDRTYEITYVTDWNEESAPSPASALAESCDQDVVTVTRTDTAPSGRNIVGWRAYRSITGNQGAGFHLVPSTDAAVAVLDSEGQFNYYKLSVNTMVDMVKDSQLDEPCPTTTWAEPPAKLIGLTEGPNGGMAGFFDNTLCPCENFVPYAFPVEYQKTTAWPIVGIGRFAQTYVVLTRGRPYYMTGADSASLDSQPIDSNHACVARRSIVNVERGVVYAAADGLCLADSSGIRLITEAHFSRQEWQALTPSSIFAAEQDGAYIFHYNNGVTSGCYALDLRLGKLDMLDGTGSAFYRDLLTDTLYIATGTTIKAMFSAGTRRQAVWRSKIICLQNYANLGWLQAQSDFAAPITVKLYREGVLTDTIVLTDRNPARLSSSRALEHEVQVESSAIVSSVTMASSAAELKAL